MKKLALGIGAVAVLMLLLAGAFAFSLTLQTLRVNAYSFAQPAVGTVIAAPMTSAAEAEIASPDSDQIRLEEFQQPERICQKDKAPERETDF